MHEHELPDRKDLTQYAYTETEVTPCQQPAWHIVQHGQQNKHIYILDTINVKISK